MVDPFAVLEDIRTAQAEPDAPLPGKPRASLRTRTTDPFQILSEIRSEQAALKIDRSKVNPPAPMTLLAGLPGAAARASESLTGIPFRALRGPTELGVKALDKALNATSVGYGGIYKLLSGKDLQDAKDSIREGQTLGKLIADDFPDIPKSSTMIEPTGPVTGALENLIGKPMEFLHDTVAKFGKPVLATTIDGILQGALINGTLKLADVAYFKKVYYPNSRISNAMPFERRAQIVGGAPKTPIEALVWEGKLPPVKVARFDIEPKPKTTAVATLWEGGGRLYKKGELQYLLKRDKAFTPAEHKPAPTAQPAQSGATVEPGPAQVPAEAPPAVVPASAAEGVVAPGAPISPVLTPSEATPLDAHAILSDIRQKSISGTPASASEITEKPSLELKRGIKKLTRGQRDALEVARIEIAQGEAGYRHVIEAGENDPNKPRTVMAVPSTFPEWFRNKGYTKERSITAIDKALAGKPITKKQTALVSDFLGSLRTPIAREMLQEREMAKTPIYYRGGGEGSMPPGSTAKDILAYERETLGNKDVVPAVPEEDLLKIKAENLVWVTQTKEQAKQYGEATPQIFEKHRVIAKDSEGGLLIEKLPGKEQPGTLEPILPGMPGQAPPPLSGPTEEQVPAHDLLADLEPNRPETAGMFPTSEIRSTKPVIEEPRQPASFPTEKIGGEPTASEIDAAQEEMGRTEAVGERQPITGPSAAVNPIRKKDIANNIAEKLGVPVRTGRFRQKALAIFKVKAEVVRLKYANDIEKLSHETAHFIYKKLGFGKELKRFSEELLPIATKPHGSGSKLAEGFAEFTRLYVTDPAKAKTAAPSFYKYFEDRIKLEEPEVLDVLLESRQNYERWLTQPASARILSQISKTAQAAKAITFDDIYTAALDDLHPIKVVTQKLTGGKPLDPQKDPYVLGRLLRSWMGKSEVFLRYGTFDFKTYALTGDPLVKSIGPHEGNLDDLRIYLAARRVIPLEARGIKTGMRVEDARHEIARLQEQFGMVASQLDVYQASLLKYLFDGEVISQDLYGKLLLIGKDNYVPFYRAIADMEGVGLGGQALADLFSPVRKIKGSTEEIIDPLESLIKNTYAFVHVVESNAVGRALAALAKTTEGSGKYIEAIPSLMRPVKVDIRSVRSQLENLGVEVSDEIAEEILTTFRPNMMPEKGGNVISVLEGGKRKFYQVEPALYKAMLALDAESVPWLVKILGTPARTLRLGATLTPEFALRNPVKDQWTAMMYSIYGYRPGFDLIKGIAHMVEADAVYIKWLQSGGARASFASMDRPAFQKTLRNLLEDPTLKGKAVYAIRHPVDTIRALAETTEEATRIGEFGRALEKLGESKGAIIAGGMAGREVTVDFARVGSQARTARALVSFLNAGAQAMDRMVRAVKDNPGRFFAMGVATITMPSIALWFMNKDEEWYKEKPQWQKDVAWWITPNYYIPKPFELGVVFGSMPERFLEHLQGENPELLKSLAASFERGFMINIVATIAVPLIENYANHSMFFDRPIVPRDVQDLLPEYQSKPMTSATANALGRVLGYSPAKTENLIRGYFGGLGKYALDAIDAAGEAAKFFPKKPEIAKKGVEGIPGLKGFYSRYPSLDSKSIQEFYEALNDSREVARTAQKLMRDKNYKEAAKVVKENHALLFSNPVLERQADLLAVNRKMINSLMRDQTSEAFPKGLTPEKRRELLDAVILDSIDKAKKMRKIVEPILKTKQKDAP